VAAEVAAQLPNERIIYFADNAHVPYGERPLNEIRAFAGQITRFLIERGAKAVVMACNMSSAVALGPTRENHPGIPILGVIDPGAKAAVDASDGAPIGVLATTGTVKCNAYMHAISRFDPVARVVQQACPKLVPLVEKGKTDSEEAEAAVRGYVEPLLREGCGTIILGCTHYPFLRCAIESAAGPDVTVVDPAKETARVLKNILLERNEASNRLSGPHAFYTSGESAGFAALGGAFLGRPIEHVTSVTWGVDLGKQSAVGLSVAS
jgi:glutamate racemase